MNFTRKHSWILAAVLGMAMSSSAFATQIRDNSNPSSEPDLYEIFNSVYCTDYSSSQQLFNARGVEEGQDWLWNALDCGSKVRITFRYAANKQSLWYQDVNGLTPILTQVEIPYGGDYHCVEFEPVNPFAFVNETGGNLWSSVTNDNIGRKDHFVALDVTDLVAPPCVSNAYMIAFEDANLGDKDYQDLVAIVECIRPIPEPATMLLLGLGSLGLAGLRRRRNA